MGQHYTEHAPGAEGAANSLLASIPLSIIPLLIQAVIQPLCACLHSIQPAAYTVTGAALGYVGVTHSGAVGPHGARVRGDSRQGSHCTLALDGLRGRGGRGLRGG